MLFKELPDMEGIEMKLSELHYIQLLDEARQEILTKGNNTVHYLKEIESRLSDGEEAVKEDNKMTDRNQLCREESCVFEGGKEMTNENKKIVADYMGWLTHPKEDWYDAPVYFAAGKAGNINFDLNDAGLVVAEMQKRGDWQDFVQITSKIHKLGFHSEVIAWLFNAENFFSAMSEWLKERGK